MLNKSANTTLDKMIKVNNIILKHLSECEDCHLREVLQEALYKDDN
jgi:hypothetical protein